MGCHRDEMRCEILLGGACALQPATSGQCVVQGFFGAEGLGAHNEQRGCRIQWRNDTAQFFRVNVGDVVNAWRSGAGRNQGLAGQPRSQVRATDAQVNHIADRLAGKTPLPLAAQCLHELPHAFPRGDDLRKARRVVRCAGPQPHVQGGTFFRVIDVATGKQSGDMRLYVCPSRKQQQVFQCDAVEKVP